jgi:hypothetical protein
MSKLHLKLCQWAQHLPAPLVHHQHHPLLSVPLDPPPKKLITCKFVCEPTIFYVNRLSVQPNNMSRASRLVLVLYSLTNFL